jgi:hypothetical protein
MAETSTETSYNHETADLEVSPTTVVKMLPTTEIKLSLTDINPVKPIWLIVRKINNVTILVPSGKPAKILWSGY